VILMVTDCEGNPIETEDLGLYFYPFFNSKCVDNGTLLNFHF